MHAEKTIWPAAWPHPDAFFDGLQDRIISIHSRQMLAGAQIIVRFEQRLRRQHPP